MADQKTGKIIRIARDDNGASKGFGIVKDNDDGTETFIHKSSYPKNVEMLEGDEIHYEIQDSPKGTRAANVVVPNPGTSKPGPSPKPSPTPSSPQDIEVGWEPRAPIRKGRSLVLPLTLSFKAGAKAKSGVEVKLKVNGKQVIDPAPNPSSDGKGEVVFLIPLQAGTKLYGLAADITVNGKTVTKTYIWEKRSKKSAAASATATPATDADKKLPEIEVVNPPRDPDATTGLFKVNVVTRRNGVKANRNFVHISDQTIEIKQRAPGGLATVTTFTPLTIGQYELYMDFDGVMAKVIFKLDNGKEAEVHLVK